MWAQIIIITTISTVCLNTVLRNGLPARQGDFELVIDDMMSVDFKEVEARSASKNQLVLNHDGTNRLSPRDLACFIAGDSYCSEDMLKLKGVLIKSIKGNCDKCVQADVDKASNAAASIINHEPPMAWNTFLDRSGIQPKAKEDLLKDNDAFKK